jgi:hypothetical protein
MALLQFSWLGYDAAARGVEAVLCDLSDEGRGDEDVDAVKFVAACGCTWDGVGTTIVERVR